MIRYGLHPLQQFSSTVLQIFMLTMLKSSSCKENLTVAINSAIKLVTLFSLKTMESLQNRVATGPLVGFDTIFWKRSCTVSDLPPKAQQIERSQIGTVQAVGYIEVRGPTEGHCQTSIQAPQVASQWYLPQVYI